MLTEKYAWSLLAECWLKAVCESGEWCAIIGPGFRSDGLCNSINDLTRLGDITLQIRRAMLNRIQLYRTATGNSKMYIWPLDREGAKARAQFCKTQAENSID